MAESRTPILEVKGITKRFPGVVALNDVHLTLYPGGSPGCYRGETGLVKAP